MSMRNCEGRVMGVSKTNARQYHTVGQTKLFYPFIIRVVLFYKDSCH